MIPLAFILALGLLTVIYVIFLYRMRIGIRLVDLRSASDVSSPDRNDRPLPVISVILPVRNEEEHVGSVLRSLAGQDYPGDRWEILVVDDESEDGTVKIVRDFMAHEPRLHLLTPTDEGHRGGKKRLIAHAVQRARGEVIVTTDADCRHHPAWLRSLALEFTDDVLFVSGPVLYSDRGSITKRLLALEFLGLVGVGAGFIGIGYPRLCNGANIAYRKQTFQDVGGFGTDDATSSGDDEFLMQRIGSTLGGVAFTPVAEAVVVTRSPDTVREFFQQRKRWASKGLHYEDKRFVAFLILLLAYFLLLFLSPLAASTSIPAACLIFVLVLAKLMAEWNLLSATAGLLAQPVRIGDCVLGQLAHVPYIIITAILGTITPYRWKNRRLKK